MKRALEEQYDGEEEVRYITNITFWCYVYCYPWLLLSFDLCGLFSSVYVQLLPQTNPVFNNTPFKFTKYSNAYMLVYIRESDKKKIICNVDEKDIAEHLRVWYG